MQPLNAQLQERLARLAAAQQRGRAAAGSPKPSDARREPLDNPFDSYDGAVHPDAQRALAAVKEWCYACHRLQAPGLIVWANQSQGQTGYGCGKTHLARAAYAYLQGCTVTTPHTAGGVPQSLGVHFLRAVDFFGAIKDAYAEKRPLAGWFDDLGDGPLIIDDLGKQYVRDESIGWAREQLFRVVDRLYERRGLLITSNMSPAEIADFVGGASWSRLAGMCGPSGEIDLSAVPDYRLSKAGFTE